MPFEQGMVAVEGLAALNRSLRQMDVELPKAIKSEFKQVATEMAATMAAGIPVKSGRMASSVKPRSSANYAAIAAYGARVPYGRYVDFGGAIEHARGVRPGSTSRATDRRPFLTRGRYIYPVLYRERDETMKAAEQAIDTALRKG